MSSLAAAIADIQTKVMTITGIKAAPANPPESMNQFPFSATYAGTVDFEIGEGQRDWKTGTYTIVTEVHWSRQNLPTAISQSVDFEHSFINKILDTTVLSATVMDVQRITGRFGFLSWGDQDNVHIGWRFETTVLIHEILT